MYLDLIKEAEKLAEDGKIEEAIEKYKQAFELDLFNDDYFNYGLLLFENKQFEESLQVFLYLSDENPDYYKYYILGVISSNLKQYADAIKYYQKAIEMNNSFYEGLNNLAAIYDRFDDQELAINLYNKILSYYPDDYITYLNLGSIYEEKNQDTIALEYFEKAYAIDCKARLVNYKLGNLFSKNNDFDLGKKYYQAEIELEDGYIYAYSNLGIIYQEEDGDLDKALQIYHQGLEIDSSVADLWYNIACNFALRKDYQNCYENLKEAINRDYDLLSYSQKDEDLSDFRKTEYFKKIIEETKTS